MPDAGVAQGSVIPTTRDGIACSLLPEDSAAKRAGAPPGHGPIPNRLLSHRPPGPTPPFPPLDRDSHEIQFFDKKGRTTAPVQASNSSARVFGNSADSGAAHRARDSKSVNLHAIVLQLTPRHSIAVIASVWT